MPPVAAGSTHEAMQAMLKAQQQYERYVELAQIAQLSVLPVPRNPGARTWSHPVTLVVRSADQNAIVE